MLLFFLLAFSLTQAAFVHQLIHGPSPNRILAKNGQLRAYRERLELARISIDASGSGSLGDYQDTEYWGNVTVGSNSQPFVVILDTATANFFIPGENCYQCKHKHKLDATKSTTFVNTTEPFHFLYEGESAYGTYVFDTLKMGGTAEKQLTIPNQKFGLADQVPVTIEAGHADGVLGLAFQSAAADGTMPPLVNAINQGLMDQPIFTVYMLTGSPFYDSTETFPGPGGQITYGALDTVNCGPVIDYQVLSSAAQWQFTISGVTYGSYVNKNRYQVISDTSYGYIGAPRSVFEAIKKEAGGASFQCWKAPTATLDFQIGTRTYSVQPINYMTQDFFDWMKEGKGDCTLNLMPIESNGFGAQWRLGTPFIRQFCNVYDYGRQRIGFAESLQYKNKAQTGTYVLNFIMDASSTAQAWYSAESSMVADLANVFALGHGSHQTRFTIGGMGSGYIFGGNATKTSDITPAFTTIQKSPLHGQGIISLGDTLSQFAASPYSAYAEHEAPPYAIIVAGQPLGDGVPDGVQNLRKLGYRYIAIDATTDGSLMDTLGSLFGNGNVCATQMNQQTATKCDQFIMHRVFENE